VFAVVTVHLQGIISPIFISDMLVLIAIIKPP
jgi:hypothetical protein